jgi:predicted MFS family arabinose efflux permease
MFRRGNKAVYFVIEGVNSFASTCFFNYLFFFLGDHFHFGNRLNLWVSALYGFIYIFAAWQGGRFGQRFGYLNALKLGCAGMAALLAVGSFLTDSAPAELLVLCCWTVMLCLTWPALEALVSEHADAQTLPRMVGLYNVVWAATAALAYFGGGEIYEWFGWKTLLFYLPGGLFAAEALLALWIANGSAAPAAPAVHLPPSAPPAETKCFLRMAWLGNPFAYIAVNTVLAVVPQIGRQLHLTVAGSGLYCSFWFFARMATFVALWFWTGWHYKFRWLAAAFAVLIAMFVVMLSVHVLWVFVLAQVAFGAAVGLLYYSSLFYSMDAGDDKGAHGGIHEAFIGAGIFAGTAVGAAALQLLPESANAGVAAVGGLLLCGFGGLFWLRRKK